MSNPITTAFGEDILPFEMGYLPEFFQKKGERELNYTQNVRENTLRQIRKALAEDSFTKDIQVNDELLLMYLSSRKHNVDRTFSVLKKYFRFRQDNPVAFKIPSFEILSPIMKSEFATVLPWRCKDGCTIILIQIDKFIYDQHPLELLQPYYGLLLMQCLIDPMTQVNGFKVIVNLGVTLEFLKLWTPRIAYTFYYGLQVIFPGRVKEVHLLNMGPLGRTVYKMIKVFLSKKIKERVHLHQSYDGLLDYFPKAVLPIKYGGELKDYDMTDWLKRVSTPEKVAWATVLF